MCLGREHVRVPGTGRLELQSVCYVCSSEVLSQAMNINSWPATVLSKNKHNIFVLQNTGNVPGTQLYSRPRHWLVGVKVGIHTDINIHQPVPETRI